MYFLPSRGGSGRTNLQLSLSHRDNYPFRKPKADSRRRRYTLALQDDRSSGRVESLLSGVSSRQCGELLRNLIITGLALHTIAPELPRLLASMPVPRLGQ